MRRLVILVLALVLPLVLSAPPADAQGAHQPMTRQDIIQVQGLLSDMGYDLSVDGLMGPGTARAIQEFEFEQGLPVTGRPTHVLIELLRALHAQGWYRTGGATTAGPSFDCARAGNAAEFAICGDPGLSYLDRELAAAYGVAASRLSAAGQRQLRDGQRAWLADRNRCGANVQCLRFAMEARIGQLR